MEYSSGEERALGRSYQLSPEQEPMSEPPPTDLYPEDVDTVSSERYKEEEA
jgi:hypothetical protein